MNSNYKRFLLRLPEQLHHELAERAKANNKSLNSYILYLLTKNIEVSPIIENQYNLTSEPENVHRYNTVKTGQNIETGRAANEFGRFLGKMIADHFGIKLEANSNKGTFRNRRVVIKSARKNNTQFGITNRMLNEIQDVLLAKESSRNVFDLYIVPIEKILDSGKPAGGKNRNKVTNFSVAFAISNGEKIDTVNVDLLRQNCSDNN